MAVFFNFIERVILSLFSKGFNAAAISDELELSVATINRHLRVAEQKAGVEHRGQLIVWVHQNEQVLRRGGTGVAGLRAA